MSASNLSAHRRNSYATIRLRTRPSTHNHARRRRHGPRTWRSHRCARACDDPRREQQGGGRAALHRERGRLDRTSSRRSSVLQASGSAPALGVALTPDGKPYRYAPPPRTPITPMTKKEQLASSTRLSSRPSTSHEPVALPDASASTQKLKSLPGGKAFGFGASTRDVANKLFVSQHHTMSLMYGMQSPGPTKYSLPPSVGGKQPDGNKPDPPVWSMGNCERFLYGYGKPETKGIPPGRAGGMRPGPADYDPERPACVEEAVGPERGGRTIKQVPHWSMGKGTRDQTHKVWITKEITQALRAGSQSPAAQYNLPDANFDKRYNCGGKPDPPVWKLHGRPHLPDFKCATAARHV